MLSFVRILGPIGGKVFEASLFGCCDARVGVSMFRQPSWRIWCVGWAKTDDVIIGW